MSLLSLALVCSAAETDAAASVSAPQVDDDGFRVHDVDSPYQAGTTQIRVLLPDRLAPERRYAVVYVLPVEAGNERRYGDGLVEIKKHDLHNRHGTIFVAPTFSHLPWYADHPTDPAIRQESHFVRVVVPFVDETYPALAEPRGRLLLGFSKSGWGAWTLLLRHPKTFARAAAWDAPLAMSRPGPFGSAAVFATPESFAEYRVTELLRENAASLRDGKRLILTGFGSFRNDHEQIHSQLDDLKIPHAYRDGPPRKHDWHSGWVAEAVQLLIGKPDKS